MSFKAGMRFTRIGLNTMARATGGSSKLVASKVNPRFYSSQADGGRPSGLVIAAVAAAGMFGGYYFLTADSKPKSAKLDSKPIDYQKVYNRVAEILEENPDYDDGSFGPILVRLAWHASGSYDAKTKSGGSCGATMRYEEGKFGANAGLEVARDLLEKIKKEFPEISYSDLWTLSGVAAIQEMGGPIIPWRSGRSDDKPEDQRPPDGRLPDASKDHSHLREVFYRMGFNDQEIVALSGAHALGRCHTDRSGFNGPWTFSPTMFTNDYYVKLLDEKWQVKKWNGPKQFEDKSSGKLMMLPTDISLIKDKEFLKYVKIYAQDEKKFFEDFSKAFSTLLELGFEFDQKKAPITFKPTI